MKRWCCALAALALLLAGCSSSGGPGAGGSTDPCDAACQASVSAADDSYLASLSAAADSESAAAAAEPITDGYDTASCADWGVTAARDRLAAALYYAYEYDDPQPEADGADLVKAITTTCDAYGAKEKPGHIAKVTIVAVYGN